MAIKISGNVIIDDSRNLTNVGIITATNLVKSGGSSSEFLKADGTTDSTAYANTGKAIAMSIVFG